MSNNEEQIAEIRAHLEKEPVVNLHRYPVEIRIEDGGVVLEGEVEHLAAKRLIPLTAARLAPDKGVIDRLRVDPGERRGDGAVLDDVAQRVREESVFKDYQLRYDAQREGATEPPAGRIEVAVNDGVVTLSGEVQSLSHKRMADVLAWWAPGSVDVDNRLKVTPPERDSDGEIADALRMVIEKDPMLDATQIHIDVQDRKVKLEGMVVNEEHRRAAELDAWAVLGVHGVDNCLQLKG